MKCFILGAIPGCLLCLYRKVFKVSLSFALHNIWIEIFNEHFRLLKFKIIWKRVYLAILDFCLQIIIYVCLQIPNAMQCIPGIYFDI